jgi:hypothetical protein
MNRIVTWMPTACGAAAILALLAMPAAAQPMMGPGGYGWGPGGYGGGPGAMMGPGWRGGGPCGVGAVGMSGWRMGVIEEIVRPNDTQRAALDALKEASRKATDAMAAACPQSDPLSAPARLEAMEKRLDAMLAAVRTVRPAFDAFYGALSDEQKRRLDASWAGGWRGHMWHWRMGAQ